MELTTRIAGIPCIVRVTHYANMPGTFSRTANSDVDYYGYEECEYDVLDRRGRPAPWLERKLTAKDEDRIGALIAEAYRDEDDCALADWAETCRTNRTNRYF